MLQKNALSECVHENGAVVVGWGVCILECSVRHSTLSEIYYLLKVVRNGVSCRLKEASAHSGIARHVLFKVEERYLEEDQIVGLQRGCLVNEPVGERVQDDAC